MDNLVKIKPHIIIQARVGSTRLPNKVMMPINGKPMIGYQIERLLKTGLPIIVATSNDLNNDKLVDYANSLGVKIFRGNEGNVLERYYKAAKLHNVKDIIRITGDNPLIDPCFITNQINTNSISHDRYYLSEGKKRSLPLGMSFEMFPYNVLEEAYLNVKTSFEKEHVTPYMHQNMPGNIRKYTFTNLEDNSDIRLTVDTNNDFKLIKELILKHNCQDKSLVEIINILKLHPYLLEVNQGAYQKSWNE